MYNAEKYICRCALSLFEQTYNNMEFIFIDDCSTDKTVEELKKVIMKYPQRKNQIKLICNEKNQGVALTRNIGLSIATGDFIGWCDSDDWISPVMYKDMFKALENNESDVVCCDYYQDSNNKSFYQKVLTQQSYSETEIDTLLCEYLLAPYNSLWNTLAKRKLYITENIKCLDGYDFCEDLNVSVKLLYSSKKVIHINKAYYHYCENLNSICHTHSHKKNISRLNNVLDIMNFLKERNKSARLNKILYYRVLIAKQFLLYNDQDVKKYIYTCPESNRYILTNPLYGIKAKFIEYTTCIIYNIILKLISIKI